MTQISSPRKFGRKRALSGNSVPTYLWPGMFILALCFWKLHLTPERSLAVLSSSMNPKPFVHHSSVRGTKVPFDWSQLQISQDAKGMCGADKCFWRSTTNPDSVGYLVASAGENYKRMKQAYAFAVEILDKKCKAKHLFLDAPERVKVSQAFVRKLNSLSHNDQNDFASQKGQSRNHEDVFDQKDHFVVVHKVKVAPNPNLMFGFMQSKWEMMVEQDIPRFRTELQSKGISLRNIEEKLESERKGIECAMEYSGTYWYDLQGLIDLEGNYFHMDIDSQFWAAIGDPSDGQEGVLTVTKAQAYKRRQNLIGRFNEMIQRLVYPPPEGVEELAAWRDGEGPNRRQNFYPSDDDY